MQAVGLFEVTMTPQDDQGRAVPGRFMLDKRFSGDLAGVGAGQILTAVTQHDSAGYVAVELITGTLHGRTGSFIFQHSSTLTRGIPTQSITVVPDSGTGDLVGLSGSMVIEIAGGEHRYVFEYTLSAVE